MNHTASILTQIKNFMEQNGLTLHRLSQKAEINTGSLSSILNGKRLLSAPHLDSITAALALPKGYFYEQYIEEFLAQTAPDWRRVRPFLDRCAELDKLECIRQVTGILLDNLMYLPLLFETAEDFFHRGRKEAAAILYENVAMSEKMQHSERLAMCHYRLFLIALSDDQDSNLRAAAQFEDHVSRLDVADQLDALKQLGHIYYSLHQWKKVDEIAQEMHRIASIQYKHHCQSARKEPEQKRSKRPLYFYIMYSHLLRSAVCEECNDYEQALKFVAYYADGSWIQEKDETAKQTAEQFQEWATANSYLYRVMSGDIEVLPDYVECILNRRGEITQALYKILQAANRYCWNVDNVLERLSAHIPYQSHRSRFGDYNKQITTDQYARFLFELANYYLQRQRHEGIELLLQSLDFSASINCESNVVRCVDLFEQNRHNAGEEERQKYKFLIRKVVEKLNEKDYDNVLSSV
ncbi:MAG: helix-turn-helix transcriptional regulator [Paenibacillus macerans]|uniref:helix-turn-helix domain-containing protein n=1 Tax=Paenibacillus macerans TaxID=44252 RepID=UPI000DF8CCC7|nr:helix-turn-helix transcriptional regulator [Paenibacillus macerans]MCY7559979.1 helix-turn-helix domain-containing protein [Paenibacillus macerans]MDU5947139.1 helix-turn-helix transcriptional regulator [Paenibacillus macerans]MDU7475306.1 helix-turn-helix transcriptional regulator [Paenibacillus macerans]MEC0138988.1 helix-turn-helix transcriptional regulator [Paenibacillus macerans]MEC0152115.1 helix-turn-helix transcriptional regulator [Paenibacillus macerans]